MKRIIVILFLILCGCSRHSYQFDGLVDDDYKKMDKEVEDINRKSMSKEEKEKMMEFVKIKYSSIAKERKVLNGDLK